MPQHPPSPAFGLGAVVVGIGAAIGALSRYGLTHTIGAEPLATTAINILGCALFGVIGVAAQSRPQLGLFLGTGFCGGFTTFSTFVLLSLTTARADEFSLATAIVAIHIIVCPLAYILGQRLANTAIESQRGKE